MIWRLSYRADPGAARVADRHYNRQSPGSAQFVPPGRCLVLRAPGPQLWVTSWPLQEYTKHAWAGAWVCSLYRREGGEVASVAIRQAIAATRAHWSEVPELGMITFLDRAQVKPVMVRGVPTWGRTWALAGFRHVGETQGGLMAWQILPADMPEPMSARGGSLSLFPACAK